MTRYSTLAVLLLMMTLIAAGLVGFTWNTARRVAVAVKPLGRFIDVNGATSHVHKQGAGPTLLLIYGLRGQLHHFTYGVVERLAPRFRGGHDRSSGFRQFAARAGHTSRSIDPSCSSRYPHQADATRTGCWRSVIH